MHLLAHMRGERTKRDDITPSTGVIYRPVRGTRISYKANVRWNIVRGYAVFYIFGLFTSGTVFVIYIIPQFMYSFAISFERLMNPSVTSMKVDAILFFTQFAVFAGLLMYSWSEKFTRVQQL